MNPITPGMPYLSSTSLAVCCCFCADDHWIT